MTAVDVLIDWQVWDLRKNDVLYRMHGHADSVTGTELSPDGSYLLTTAMDNTGLLIWHLLTTLYKTPPPSCWVSVAIWDQCYLPADTSEHTPS